MIVHIILAAGAGTRVGQPKGLLSLGGVPLVARLVHESIAAGTQAIIVVTGAQSHAVAGCLQSVGSDFVRIIENKAWELGQTSSIRTGLVQLPTNATAFMIHPVDHALVRSHHLRSLFNAWETQESPRAILRPQFGANFGHPVLFASGYAPEFLALADHEPGHTVYRRHLREVVGVPMPDDGCNFDLDTPADLAEATRRVCS